MKRIKNSDIKFRINKKLVYLPNFVIRFYTVNQKEYFFEKTQDDLVEYEREATVDDVEVILSGGTTVTEYYLPLNWSELLFVGQGILNYKLTNNIEDPEFPDYQYNKEEVVTTDFYIDSIKVDPEPDESLIERVIQLEEHLAEEIVNREEADAIIRENLNEEEARAISAETALDEKIDDEIERATSAETALQTAINDEATARANTDTALQTAITNEVSRAIEAESGITNSLNAEVTRATGAENALDAKIDAETTRATSAEAALDVKISTVSGNVITETTRATTAENALSGAIDSISAATSGSVEELDAKIDQEITDRTADVDAEETRAKGVENALSGAIDTLDAKFIDDAKYEDSGNTKVINFYNGNVVKATIDCTDFLVDGMIDNVYIENGYLVIDFNTASGKQDIRIPLTDIFNPANYYTKSETSGATEIATALAQKLAISDFNTYSGAVDTAINSKASQSTVDALNSVVTAHIADDSIHFTTGAVQTQIDNSISGKANSSDVYLKTETSGATELATAFVAKQNQLVAGENITIDANNVISAEGGGKAIVAGTGIAITTGETANTVSLDINAKKGSSNTALVFNYINSNTATAAGATSFGYMCKATNQYTFANGNNTQAKGYYSHSEGETTIANGWASHSDGQYTNANGKASHTEGSYVNAENDYESSQGRYNVSNKANTTWGDSGNTLFSVGNGTANNARHNAFEIRQNGDIYISLNGQDVKLQDQLGGGGSSYSAGDGIDITNDVISVTGKVSTSDFNTYSGNVDTAINSKASQSTVDTLSGTVTAHTADTSIHFTTGTVQTLIDESISGKASQSDLEVLSGTVEDNEEVTAQAFNVLNAELANKLDASAYTPTDLSNYYTKSETSGATELATAFAATQPKLSAGTGISIDANNVISATGGTGGGISSAECQTMIDQSISGKTNQSDFTGHTANTSIHVTTAQTAAWDAKSDFSGSYNDLTDKPTIPTVPTSNTAFTNDAGYITSNDITGKTDTTAFTAHTASTVHMTTTEKTNLDSLATNISAISGITSTKVSNWDGAATNASNAVTALGGLTLWKGTQAQYDALATKDNNTLYVIVG